jgi:hypothetical protein
MMIRLDDDWRIIRPLSAASASMCYIIFLPELGISDSASVGITSYFYPN